MGRGASVLKRIRFLLLIVCGHVILSKSCSMGAPRIHTKAGSPHKSLMPSPAYMVQKKRRVSLLSARNAQHTSLNRSCCTTLYIRQTCVGESVDCSFCAFTAGWRWMKKAVRAEPCTCIRPCSGPVKNDRVACMQGARRKRPARLRTCCSGRIRSSVGRWDVLAAFFWSVHATSCVRNTFS